MKTLQISKEEKSYHAAAGSKLVKFSENIPFEATYSYTKNYALTANVTLVPKTKSAIPGAKTVYRLVGNGTATVTLTAFKITSTSGTFDDTDEVLNVLEFTYDGTDYWVNIYQEA